MAGRQLCQWDKDSRSDAGFLKIDLLGLGMLSAVEDCVEQIAELTVSRSTSRASRSTTPTCSTTSSAPTRSATSRSSRAQMQSLLRTRPENLDDLTVQVALVRPGPIQGKAVHPYIEHRRRLREDLVVRWPVDHPSLREPLRSTLGVVVFQDQVLDVAMALAGFSGGGGGVAPRDEPQAERGGDRGVPRPLRRGRGAERGGGRTADAVYDKLAGFSASASRSRMRPPSGCSPTSRPGCGTTIRPSSSARC